MATKVTKEESLQGIWYKFNELAQLYRKTAGFKNCFEFKAVYFERYGHSITQTLYNKNAPRSLGNGLNLVLVTNIPVAGQKQETYGVTTTEDNKIFICEILSRSSTPQRRPGRPVPEPEHFITVFVPTDVQAMANGHNGAAIGKIVDFFMEKGEFSTYVDVKPPRPQRPPLVNEAFEGQVSYLNQQLAALAKEFPNLKFAEVPFEGSAKSSHQKLSSLIATNAIGRPVSGGNDGTQTILGFTYIPAEEGFSLVRIERLPGFGRCQPTYTVPLFPNLVEFITDPRSNIDNQVERLRQGIKQNGLAAFDFGGSETFSFKRGIGRQSRSPAGG